MVLKVNEVFDVLSESAFLEILHFSFRSKVSFDRKTDKYCSLVAFRNDDFVFHNELTALLSAQDNVFRYSKAD